MTDHTPGPWEVRGTQHQGDVAVYKVDGRWIADAVQSGDRNYLPERWAEAEANARLIAAAPDLLAALHLAFEVIRLEADAAPGNSDFWNEGGEGYAAYIAAEAAIAKATGND